MSRSEVTTTTTDSTPTTMTSTTPPSQPFHSLRVAVIAVAFFVLHFLPGLWIIHCASVLLWLFPLTETLAGNCVVLLITLLLFIVSGVHLNDYYVRRGITIALIGITLHHYLLGHFDPLLSWKNLVYITWVILPVRNYFSKNIGRLDRVANWYLGLPLWNWMVESYFPITIVHDDETLAKGIINKDDKTKYFFVYHPHGLWPWGLWLSLVTRWKEFYPNVTWRVLAATPLLMLPYIGDYMQSIGGISADWHTSSKAVAAGHSLVVLPGGLAEAMLSDPTHYAILLKPRRGFIKMAIVNGLSLVPIFGFGETRLYHQISFWRELRLRLSRKTGFPITLFAGAYGSTVPRRSPIRVVIGKALPVKKNEKPSHEEIDALYHQYEAALLELYNKYRPADAGPLVLY